MAEIDDVGPELPDRLYLRIGEVARLTGVEPHVLRYWETEFRALRPRKSRSGQRLYRRQDVQLVLLLKELLWERRYTIAGAMAEVARLRKGIDPQPAPGPETVEPPEAPGEGPPASYPMTVPAAPVPQRGRGSTSLLVGPSGASATPVPLLSPHPGPAVADPSPEPQDAARRAAFLALRGDVAALLDEVRARIRTLS